MHFPDKLFGKKQVEETADKPLGIPIYIPPAQGGQEQPVQNEHVQPVQSGQTPPIQPAEITKRSDIPQLEMTFQEAQKAGFQFRCRKARQHDTTVIITGIHIKNSQLIIPAKINGYEVKKIGDWCKFIIDKTLTEIKLYLPNTLMYIGDYAFKECRKLTAVYFPEGTVYIGNNAFVWLNNLKELHFGNRTIIGNDAFRYCSALECVELNVCSFGKGAFYGCDNLWSVKWTIVESPSEEVFYNTPFEKSQELLIINNILQRYSGKEKIFVVPEGVKKIGSNAFSWCKTLERVVLPESVNSIGECAFIRCDSLKEINLENVFDIHDSAFGGCTSFGGNVRFNERVTFYGTPFWHSLLGDENTTPDGIVINDTLMTMGNNFIDDVWTISEGIRRISCDKQSGFTMFGCYGKTVIIPRSMEKIDTLNCFEHAKRIVIKNRDITIGSSTNFARHKDFTLCFEIEEGVSEFIFYYPKWKKDNPVYPAVDKLYSAFFENLDRHGIYEYDKKILTIGLTYRQMLDVAYKRFVGGYMLDEKNRERYMDFVRTHRKKGLKYAIERNDTSQIEFFKQLCAK